MFKKVCSELNGIRLQLDALTKALRIASDGFREGSLGSGDPERISILEGRIESVIGMVEAGITKAESLKGAARAAEDRTRGHMKRAEAALELAESAGGGEEIDPFEAAGRQFEADLAAEGNGKDLAPEEVPSMLTSLDDRRARRQLARNAKRR